MTQAPSVLLIIDLQAGFVTDGSRHVVAPLEALQSGFDHVVVTKFHNPDPSPFRDILYYDKMTADTPETALAFAPRADAVIIDRPLYTCVIPELLSQLANWQARDIHIGGIATEACVLKSVIDLFEHGFCPWILTDLCASDKDRRFHDNALHVLGKLIDPSHLVVSCYLPGFLRDRQIHE